jgi:hypothetical protein
MTFLLFSCILMYLILILRFGSMLELGCYAIPKRIKVQCMYAGNVVVWTRCLHSK